MSISVLVAKRPLRRSATGNAVSDLQAALRAHGAEIEIDADFGPITEAAVRRFQAAHGLIVDGVVGADTATVLDAPIAEPAATASRTPLGSALDVAPWLSVMRALTGTKELPGSAAEHHM